MKKNLSRESIVESAVLLADAEGLTNLRMSALAEKLGVKSPSLYKHLPGGLEELTGEIARCGWQRVDEAIARSAVGKSRDEAIRAICHAFRDFARAHPGAFEALKWYNSYVSEEKRAATMGIIASLNQVLDGYGMNDLQKLHMVRFLRGFVQGFSMIEAHGGFGDPASIEESFDFALNIIIEGIDALGKKA